MTTPPDGVLLLEREDRVPERIPFPGGEVLGFSSRGPDHPVNEDAAAVLPYRAGGLLAVADGMGGQSSGARASRLAIETLVLRISAGDEEAQPLRHVVLDGIEAADHAVLELGVGAGTTFAAIVLRDGRARSVHVGDSMVLHVGQRGRVKALTIPHSPTGYAVEAGLLHEDDAMVHDERHVVSNYVGRVGMRIEIGASVPIAVYDTLLVASDGLADNVSLEEIIAIVRKGPLEAAAARLVELSLERMASGGGDTPSKPDDLTFLLHRRLSTG